MKKITEKQRAENRKIYENGFEEGYSVARRLYNRFGEEIKPFRFRFEILKELRSKNGLSQKFVSNWIGISRPTYIKLEKGEGTLLLDTAMLLTKLYDIKIGELLSED